MFRFQYRILAVLLLLGLPCTLHSQLGPSAPRWGVPSSKPDTVDPTLPMNDTSYMQDQRVLHMLNVARQKSLVADADKLVKLAHELDAEVATNKEAVLTASELRKIARIEKLAHNVKIGMATSVGGGPRIQEPFPPLDQ